MPINFRERYKKWLLCLERDCLDGFLISHPPNLSYLFNFNGSVGLAYCIQGESYLIVDSRYFELAETTTLNCQVIQSSVSLENTLRALIKKKTNQNSRLGFEAHHVPFYRSHQIQSWNPELTWLATTQIVEELRIVKDDCEIHCLEKAFNIAQTAWKNIENRFTVGMSELEIAGLLELEIRKAGGEGFAFETIVASGSRSSLPHASPSNKLLTAQEFLLIDFGLKYKGYCSDMTRIYQLPETSLPSIYQIVQEAQANALSKIKPGVSSTEIDQAARKTISASGYGDYFGHSTGHGLGLEVHELPTISPRKETEICEKMVFTVEPGIYLPNRYGIRIEDTVVVTKTGYRLLSQRVT